MPLQEPSRIADDDRRVNRRWARRSSRLSVLPAHSECGDLSLFVSFVCFVVETDPTRRRRLGWKREWRRGNRLRRAGSRFLPSSRPCPPRQSETQTFRFLVVRMSRHRSFPRESQSLLMIRKVRPRILVLPETYQGWPMASRSQRHRVGSQTGSNRGTSSLCHVPHLAPSFLEVWILSPEFRVAFVPPVPRPSSVSCGSRRSTLLRLWTLVSWPSTINFCPTLDSPLFLFRISTFGFRTCFEFGASDFGFRPVGLWTLDSRPFPGSQLSTLVWLSPLDRFSALDWLPSVFRSDRFVVVSAAQCERTDEPDEGGAGRWITIACSKSC